MKTIPIYSSENPELPNKWLFYLIAATGVIIALLLWYTFILQERAHNSNIIQLQTNHIAATVKTQFALRIEALRHMALHISTEPGSTKNAWQDTLEYANNYGGFEALAWFDNNWKILATSSLVNTNVSYFYKNFVKQYAKTAEEAIRQHPIWLSPAFSISSHQEGMFVVFPIVKSGYPPQFFVSIINFAKAFNLGIKPTDYALMIMYDNQKILDKGTIDISNAIGPRVATMNLYGSTWKIYVQPTPQLIHSTLQTRLPFIAFIFGITIALLFAITTRLNQLARQRAGFLDRANKNLQIEIAERIQAEETKQQLEKALLQGQKLQAIGTLAGGIAHDFNNILYAIIGYVEMAKDDTQSDSLLYQNLSRVLEAANRGQDLIASILAFSRRQHNELKPLRLKETTTSALTLLKPTIPASVNIDYQNHIEDSLLVLGDQTRIHQIIVNVINNAIDAMNGEGTITIQLDSIKENDPLLIQFPEKKYQNYCKIAVSDTGYGMDQQTIERIFEPFFTTKEVGKGTGLGLATVHAIVKEHLGEIIVQSQLGQGSTFIIILPEYTA